MWGEHSFVCVCMCPSGCTGMSDCVCMCACSCIMYKQCLHVNPCLCLYLIKECVHGYSLDAGGGGYSCIRSQD